MSSVFSALISALPSSVLITFSDGFSSQESKVNTAPGYVLTGLRGEKHFFSPSSSNVSSHVEAHWTVWIMCPNLSQSLARRRDYADWLSLGHMTPRQAWSRLLPVSGTEGEEGGSWRSVWLFFKKQRQGLPWWSSG